MQDKDPTLTSLGARDKIRKYLHGLAEHTKLPIESVVGTLGKLSLEDRHTGIDQPDLEIIHALGQIAPYSQLRWHQLLLGVRLVRGRVWDGSSLALEGFVPETHDLTGDFSAHLQRLRVARKCIDAGELAAVLSPANTADAAEELLTIAGFLERDAVPPGLGHLELKMAAGAIGYSDIEQLQR